MDQPRHIIFVKKIKKDGSPCRKCADVQAKLDDNNQMQFINETIYADERHPESEGMKLAESLNVDRAPFFVVYDNGDKKVYTVYLKFVKEVLKQQTAVTEINKEILENNPDLDFL